MEHQQYAMEVVTLTMGVEQIIITSRNTPMAILIN